MLESAWLLLLPIVMGIAISLTPAQADPFAAAQPKHLVPKLTDELAKPAEEPAPDVIAPGNR
jgi:hypothetical protein